MTVVFFPTLAALVAALVARSLVRLRIPRLLAANLRGTKIPVVLGLAIAAGTMGLLLGSIVAALSAGAWSPRAEQLTLVMVAGLVVVAVGFVDDLSAGASRGWRGHLGAAGRGHVTTGAVKIVGVGLAGLAVAWAESTPLILDTASLARLAASVVFIAGAANVTNGLDVAPGRAGKWFLLLGLPIAVLAPHSPGWAVLLVVIGAEVGVLWFDLRERAMLGDAGSNLLGFVLAAAALPALDLVGVVVAAVLVIGLNVVAETVTFSRVIERVAPLRWFDRLGRLPSGPTFSAN